MGLLLPPYGENAEVLLEKQEFNKSVILILVLAL